MTRILGIDPGSRVTGYGIIDQAGCQFANRETEALFETDGSEHAGGILDKTQIVQNPYRFFFDVFLRRKKIDKGSKVSFIELNRQGIDRKILR